MIRLTWPTAIKAADVYSLTDKSDLVIYTRVKSRQKQDQTLVHYYVALVPWYRRFAWVIRPLRRLPLTEIALEAYENYASPPSIKAAPACLLGVA